MLFTLPRAGATWVQEMQVAQQLQPQFLLICQWNEFAGQPNGSPGYTDSYNVSLSNDFEPTRFVLCVCVVCVCCVCVCVCVCLLWKKEGCVCVCESNIHS